MKTRAKRREEENARKRRTETIPENEESRCKINDDDVDSSLSPPPLECRYMYVCVYCGSPCAALYRQLNKNSLSSIKAMHCERCQRIVDPYIEREWLLVVIDCILLRPEAYRHILYNSQDLSWYVHIQKEETGFQQQEKGHRNHAAAAATSTSRIQRLVQWTLVSSLFHAYLKWQTLVHTQQQHRVKDGDAMSLMFANDDSSTLLYATFFMTSVLDLAAQWLAIYGFMKILSIYSESSSDNCTNTVKRKDDDNDKKIVFEKSKDSRPSSLPPSHSIAYQIYLGLLLPTSFQMVCALVLLWENSKTTRALGSLLIACWQCLGISLISINNGSKTSTKSSVLESCTPLVGIASLILWRFGLGRFLLFMTETNNDVSSNFLNRTIPCVGFEVDVFGDVVNGIANEYFVGSVDRASSPILLCLT